MIGAQWWGNKRCRRLGCSLNSVLPVPAEILVCTEAEWAAVLAHDDRFARVMATEVVWVLERLRSRGS